MKNRSVTLSLLTATLFAIPVFVGAEPTAEPTSTGSRSPGPRHAEMVKRFDQNGDGRLDEAERQTARTEMRQRWGAHRGPGGLNGPHGKMRAQRLQRFDHDHDGRLNEAERAEARAAGEQQRAQAQVRRQQMLSRFDRDGDGKLGEAERTEMRSAWQKFLEQQPPLNSPAK